MARDDFDFRLQQHLFGLPTNLRLWVGAVVAVAGAALFVHSWNEGWFVGWWLFFAVLGVALVGNAWGELGRQRRIDAEVTRARGEAERLRRDLAEARRTKGNVARLLQQRGYREYAVRQWIQRELAPPLRS